MEKFGSLILNNGDVFSGRLIGAPVHSSGEMVFTTGMVGYSETLTDPSYFGQIIIFAYPLIGNYGIPTLPEDPGAIIPAGFESRSIHAAGAILAMDSPEVYHWNSIEALDLWLKKFGVPCLVGLDTRHLIQLTRDLKSPLGRIEPKEPEGNRRLGDSFSFELDKEHFFDPGDFNVLPYISSHSRKIYGKGKRRVALIDCGVKWNIIRQLLAFDCEVELIPWDTDLKTVDASGWLISNGPGDPENTGNLISQVKNLVDDVRPILGICLGHQILCLAIGCKTQKMAFGHRSHNQPVQLCGTRKGFITSQNHGYMVLEDSIPNEWDTWFINANDKTIEGIKHRSKPFFSCQFHPEAAGGPRDTDWIISDFVACLKDR